MFKIIDTVEETIRWPVVVEMPLDGGKIRKYEFTGIFRRLSADEKEALGKEIGEDMINDENVDWTERFIERTTRVMTGWDDVCDADGKKVDFCADNLRRAVRAPSGVSFMKGVQRAITEFETGTRAKN